MYLLRFRSRRALEALIVIALLSPACSSGGDTPSPTESGSTVQELRVEEPARLYAPQAGDRAAAVTAGDFNGDGLTDIALAAAFADGPDNTRPDGGEVYVFAGPFGPGETRDAADGGQLMTVFGTAAGDQAGRALATADFDGDGVDDLVIGSPAADGPSSDRADAGRVDVVFGSRELGQAAALDLAATSEFTVHGAAAGDLAGFSLDSGNLNSDQSTDLVIGAFYAGGPGDVRPLAGEVYAVYGGALRGRVVDLAISPADVTVYGSAADDRLGESVAAGDVSGDGIDDLALAAPFAVNLEDLRDAGRTYVLQSPLPAVLDLAAYSPLATIYGVDDGDQLGHVTALGELDGDDEEDVLLTAVSADGPGNSVDLAGEATIVLSRMLKETVDVASGDAHATVSGPGAEARLGRSAAIGDIDGDGVGEVIVGAPGTPAADGSQHGGSLFVLRSTGLAAENAILDVSRAYTGEEGGAALATEIYGRMPVITAPLDGRPGDEIVVSASGGDGPDGSRADSGYALILFISP